MSKVTVEDQSGRIQFSDGWRQNAVCVACDTTVDKVLQAASGGTWMQTWWAPETSLVTATLDFEGTGVDAYFLFFWRSLDPNSNGEGMLHFFMDDKLEMSKPVVASDYQFTGDIAPRSLVFSKSGYSAGKHTLRIHWTNNGPRPRVAVALDRIDYTPIPAPAPAPAPGSSTTSSSTTAAAPTSSPPNTSLTSGKASDTDTSSRSSSSSATSTTSSGAAPGATGFGDAAGPPNTGSEGSASSPNDGGGDGGPKESGKGLSAGSNSGSDSGDQVSGSSNNTAKIVGPVVAVVVLIALLLGGLLIWRRRRRRARAAEYVNHNAANPFSPTAHGTSPFNHVVTDHTPNMYMTASHMPPTPVSQVVGPFGTTQQAIPHHPGHQRSISNSQQSWNTASAYTGYTGMSAGSDPFTASSGEATHGSGAEPNAAFSPPPYSVGPTQTVAASGQQKRRIVS